MGEETRHAPGEPPAIWVTSNRREARDYAFMAAGKGFVHLLHLAIQPDELAHATPRSDRSNDHWPNDVAMLHAHQRAHHISPTELGPEPDYTKLALEARTSGIVAIAYSSSNYAVVNHQRLSVLGSQIAAIE